MQINITISLNSEDIYYRDEEDNSHVDWSKLNYLKAEIDRYYSEIPELEDIIVYGYYGDRDDEAFEFIKAIEDSYEYTVRFK